MIKKWFTLAAAIGGLVLAMGCQTERFTDPIVGPVYQPKNVFCQSARLPQNLRRVAVLPLSYNADDPWQVSGRQVLEPILRIGLDKAQRFESVGVSAAQIEQWTGREKWSAREQLPQDLLQTVKREMGCDAVLFCELTHYRPYPPMVIGWNLKLVELKNQSVLWAADEVLDAGDESVANGARLFERGRQKENPNLDDSRQVLHSPQRFGQYTIELLLGTLPAR